MNNFMYAFFENENEEIIYDVEQAMNYSEQFKVRLKEDFDINVNFKVGTFWRYLIAICAINMVKNKGNDLEMFVAKYLQLSKSIFAYVYTKTKLNVLLKSCEVHMEETNYFIKCYFEEIAPTVIQYMKEGKYKTIIDFSILGVL